MGWFSSPEYWLSRMVFQRALAVIYLVAFIAVYGTAFGAVSPLRASVLADHFGRLSYGAITSVQGVPAGIFAGLGPFLAGLLYDLLGGYSLAFLLTAAAFLAASLAVFATPRPAPKVALE